MGWNPTQSLNPVVVYDTDLHGGLSGLIAIRALQRAGYRVIRHYSNFNRAPPATTPSTVADTLPGLVAPGSADLVMLDIPIDVQNPKKFVDTLAQYVWAGKRVIYIDHHGHSQWTKALMDVGVHVVITDTSYGMSLYLPRVLGVVDQDMERFALIAAIGDFDESVAHRVTPELEEAVTEYLDTAWKFGFRSIPEVQSLASTYGNVGAIVEWLNARNVGPEELLMLARQYGQPVPLLRHRTTAYVVVAEELPPQGLAWKCAAKLTRVTGLPIAVVIQEVPQRNQWSVIVATDWKRKSEYGAFVDRVVQEVAMGRSVVGHPGARSILTMTLDEARAVAEQVVRRLNEVIETERYTPRAVRLINESHVARALAEDYRYLNDRMVRIEQLLERIASALERGALAKEQQVQLLKELYQRDERTRYD